MQTMEVYNILHSAIISYKNELDEEDSLFYINYLNNNNQKVINYNYPIYLLIIIFTIFQIISI